MTDTALLLDCIHTCKYMSSSWFLKTLKESKITRVRVEVHENYSHAPNSAGSNQMYSVWVVRRCGSIQGSDEFPCGLTRANISSMLKFSSPKTVSA